VIFEVLKQKAKELKKQTITVYFASRDPNLSMHIKIIAILVAAYALSPIDLIPDFIPIFGLLDDIIIVPLGLALIIYLTPPEIIEAAQIKALQSAERPTSYMAALLFIFIWLTILLLSGQWFYHEFIT